MQNPVNYNIDPVKTDVIISDNAINQAIANLRMLGRRNRINVLRIIRKIPGITNTEICIRTKEVQPEISQAIKDLKDNKLIITEKHGKYHKYFVNEEVLYLWLHAIKLINHIADELTTDIRNPETAKTHDQDHAETQTQATSEYLPAN